VSTSSPTQWIGGWTVDNPAEIDYVAVGKDEGTWQSFSEGRTEARDLGLTEASNGQISAFHIRKTGEDSGLGEWHCYDLDFEFFFVLKGSMRLETQEGEVYEFGPGDAGVHPGLYWHRAHSLSGDLEVVRITAPANAKRIDGRDSPLPERAASLPADRTAVYSRETPENYELGAGPRKFFRYRDLGTRQISDERIHIHVVRASEPGTGTGWHYHSMAQWFMIVGGDSWIRVEDRPAEHLEVGDTMCIGSGQNMRHNVAPFSGDYAVLEMCVPAQYETVAVPPPDGADAPPVEGTKE
jgi:quercetin dioxygenase-like cupin family protein